MRLSEDPLPNLFIIGAAKCGTTSLHRYLDAHPEISMSEPKEPRVFADEVWRRRLGEYAGMFAAPEAPVRGESSTLYSRFPVVRGIPDRVASACPDASLIYVVRDPVERVVANWLQRYENRAEARQLAAALEDLDQPENQYVAASRYATQLEQWLRRFPRERVLVVDQADLHRSRAKTLLAVLRFLRVRPELPSNLDAEFNVSGAKRVMTPAAARRWFGLWPLTRKLPARIRDGLSRTPLFPVERVGSPALDDDLRTALAAELRGEADRFRELTGMAFASWTV
jgi:hypothetical protein